MLQFSLLLCFHIMLYSIQHYSMAYTIFYTLQHSYTQKCVVHANTCSCSACMGVHADVSFVAQFVVRSRSSCTCIYDAYAILFTWWRNIWHPYTMAYQSLFAWCKYDLGLQHSQLMMHGNCVWYSSEVKRKQKKNLTEMRQNNLSMAEHSQRCQIKLK